MSTGSEDVWRDPSDQARPRWERVKGDYYLGLALNIRSITSAPVVMTGRSSCR